jgi:biopolymer transport protein ExbD
VRRVVLSVLVFAAAAVAAEFELPVVPGAPAAPATPPPELCVSLDAHGNLRIGDAPATLDGLAAALGKAARTDHGATRRGLRLRLDARTPWRNVAWLMTVAAMNGFLDLAFDVRASDAAGRIDVTLPVSPSCGLERSKDVVANLVVIGDERTPRAYGDGRDAPRVATPARFRYRLGDRESADAASIAGWLDACRRDVPEGGTLRVVEVFTQRDVPVSAVLATIVRVRAAGVDDVWMKMGFPVPFFRWTAFEVSSDGPRRAEVCFGARQPTDAGPLVASLTLVGEERVLRPYGDDALTPRVATPMKVRWLFGKSETRDATTVRTWLEAEARTAATRGACLWAVRISAESDVPVEAVIETIVQAQAAGVKEIRLDDTTRPGGTAPGRPAPPLASARLPYPEPSRPDGRPHLEPYWRDPDPPPPPPPPGPR